MPRYIGIKDGRIKLISTQSFTHNDLQILLLPLELEDIDNETLMLNYRVREDHVIPIKGCQNTKALKVAFITNYKQACGISTYGEHLIPTIIPHIGDFKLFVEEVEDPTSDLL